MKKEQNNIVASSELAVNYMLLQNKMYIAVKKIASINELVYDRLKESDLLSNYDTSGLTTSSTQIEQDILCHNNYLKLDIDGDIVYSKIPLTKLAEIEKFKMDENICNYIKQFINNEKELPKVLQLIKQQKTSF